MKDPKKVARGKKSRKDGGNFELRVRKDLEMRGWIVSKWPNNIEFEEDADKQILSWTGKIIPAKAKFRGFGIPMAMGTGFPDFIGFRKILAAPQGKSIIINKKCDYCEKDAQVVEFKMSAIYEVIGVEAKTNGKLDKAEREKCQWYLDNKIFSKILIAKKTKEGRRVVVVYTDFLEEYDK